MKFIEESYYSVIYKYRVLKNSVDDLVLTDSLTDYKKRNTWEALPSISLF